MSNLSIALSNFNKFKDINCFDNLLEGYSSDLKKAIISTIQGDHYSIYEYIFSLDCSYKEEFCWLGWVNSVKGKNIVWTVCKFDSLFSDYYNSTQNFLNTIAEDIPKRVIFLTPLVISDWQNKDEVFLRESNNKSEFDVFQVPNYEGVNNWNSDIDQIYLMNGSRLKKHSIYAYEKFKSLCSEKSISVLEELVFPNLHLYSFHHVDMHNIGHFLGNWPYDRKFKDIALTGFIEEMRSCFQGVFTYYCNPKIDNHNKLGFLIYVILNRFVLGWDSYVDEITKEYQSNESIREISTSIGMFLEMFNRGGIQVKNQKIDLNIDLLFSNLVGVLDEINYIELNRNEYLLQRYSITKLSQYYPNSELHPIISELWSKS